MPVREKFPLYEKLDFLNIGGGIFQELNMNIIESSDFFSLKFINYKLDTLLKLKSKVIVTFIYSNSYLGKLDVFGDGTIITKLNNKNIKSYSHFKTMIQQNKNKKIKLESEDGKIVFIELTEENKKENTELKMVKNLLKL